MSIIPAFLKYPEQAAVIGRLLAGYGELEIDLAQCLIPSLGNIDNALKVTFRTRGEEQRITVVDAIVRPTVPKPIFHFYCKTVADLHVCRKIRNQFAHNHYWFDEGDAEMAIFAMEETVRATDNLVMSKRFIPLSLLNDQEEFFINVQSRLTYLRHQLGREPDEKPRKPKAKAPPKLNLKP